MLKFFKYIITINEKKRGIVNGLLLTPIFFTSNNKTIIAVYF